MEIGMMIRITSSSSSSKMLSANFKESMLFKPTHLVEAEGDRIEFFSAKNQQFRCTGGGRLPAYQTTRIAQFALAFLFKHSPHGKGYQDYVTWLSGDVPSAILITNPIRKLTLSVVLQRFFLAGNPRKTQQQQQEGSANIFHGFDLEILSQAFNVDPQTAQKLQSPGDNRGHIIMVERGLQVIKPPVSFEQQEDLGNANGFEETICSAKLLANIDNPSHVDFYNPQAGRRTHLNSHNSPSSKWFNTAPREEFFTVTCPETSYKLITVSGGYLQNAMASPYWVMNAHSILHVTRGSMRMQIVNNKGQSVLNDQIREGQLVVVPQNFAVVKQAGQEGCRWIAFRTNDNAMINTLAGHNSAIRAMPVDVIASAYQMSREQASNLKFNRKEMVMFKPRSMTWGRSVSA
ncbi:hypothetical protein OSB04_000932 [Centaurea solstitialis]|uniref:Cupin type-1 domain-containing protein n=1 Tax=Centaurea solstitialis TaxID=347529 RepID=A0AA38WUR5_9ASTR|nr:hypothetical protein OSB04_000932 [Centaurea solstitialis]